MKRLIVLATSLTLGAASVMAQGYVDGLNQNSAVLIQVEDPAINGGNPVVAGTPANAAGFVGAGPGQVAIELFIAPNGTSLSALESGTPYLITGNVSTTIAGAQGAIAYSNPGGDPLYLPNQPGVYDGSQPVEFIYYGITSGGTYAGWSSEGIITPAVSHSAQVPPLLFGTGAGQISSFVLTPGGEPLQPVPEPATIALAGLGTAALLLFRRRK